MFKTLASLTCPVVVMENAAIQETCGFKNANALKNLFKRRYNMSMRNYRAQNSQK